MGKTAAGFQIENLHINRHRPGAVKSDDLHGLAGCENLDGDLPVGLNTAGQNGINLLGNIPGQAAIDNRLDTVRGKPVLVLKIGVVLKYLCVHNPLHVLEEGRPDSVSIDAASKVHGGIVTIPKFLVCFPFPAPSKRRGVSDGHQPRNCARIGNDRDRFGGHVALGPRHGTSGRDKGRVIRSDFRLRHGIKLNAAVRPRQPSLRDDRASWASDNQVPRGLLCGEQLQSNGPAQVEKACSNRRVNEAAVVNVLNQREQDIQNPGVNAEKHTYRAAYRQIGGRPEQLPGLVLQSVKQLCVGRPSKT